MNYGNGALVYYDPSHYLQVLQQNIHSLQARVEVLETRLNEMQQEQTFHHNQVSRVSGTPTAIQQSCAGQFHMNDIVHRHEELISHLVMYQEEDKIDGYSPYLQTKMQRARNYMIRRLIIMIEDLDDIDRLWGRTFEHCVDKYKRAEWNRILSICITSLNQIKASNVQSQNGNFDKNCDALINMFQKELDRAQVARA